MKYNKRYVDSNRELSHILFWKPNERNGIYSQWYKAPMVEDGVRYNCCEQYMMAQKALLFNDHKTYDMIMRDGNPANMKKYGRMVRNFNDAVWNEKKFDIVKRGNYLKFSQNSELKEMLLDTDDDILVEASPYDGVWGIKSTESRYWNGENLLGFAIMEVRDLERN